MSIVVKWLGGGLRKLPRASAVLQIGIIGLDHILHFSNDWHDGIAIMGSFVTLIVGLIALRSSWRWEQKVNDRHEAALQLAGYDALCGLPNRVTFGAHLDAEIARSQPDGEGIAVHFLDLDRFKAVNDTLGHAAGDELLKHFASRMKKLLRGADLIARFGGDEFAIIQTGVKNGKEAEALAKRIIQATSEPFRLRDGTANVGVSIGIALAPEHAREGEPLMRFADIALYASKNDGRNRVTTFAQSMDRLLHLRGMVADRMRIALENGELKLHYTPQFAMDRQSIVSMEATLRWHDRSFGEIPASDFLPMVESTGQIKRLTDWMLRSAIADASKWPDHVRVALNISSNQFKNAEFVTTISRALEETGFDPARLELELLESVLIDHPTAAEETIIALREFGIRFVLDNFGTGYSSLIFLRRFAFDTIKFDHAFLASMEETSESATIAHSIVHLAHALGLKVSAEGVESEQQLWFLQSLGCNFVQGPFLAKPMSHKMVLEMLKRIKKSSSGVAARAA
jgi:diguanylate cyclase